MDCVWLPESLAALLDQQHEDDRLDRALTARCPDPDLTIGEMVARGLFESGRLAGPWASYAID